MKARTQLVKDDDNALHERLGENLLLHFFDLLVQRLVIAVHGAVDLRFLQQLLALARAETRGLKNHRSCSKAIQNDDRRP